MSAGGWWSTLLAGALLACGGEVTAPNGPGRNAGTGPAASAKCGAPAFEDPRVAAAVQAEVARQTGSSALDAEALALVTILRVQSPTSLEGLQCLPNLSVFHAQGDAPFADLSPLRSLSHLTSLRLTDSMVSDISALESVPALRLLDLSRSPLSSIQPLVGKNGLEDLYLRDTQVEDLSALSTHVGLQNLEVAGTLVRDLGPLRHLTQLGRIDLGRTPVEDLSPLLRPPPDVSCPEILLGSNLSPESRESHVPALCQMGWSIPGGDCGRACSFK